MKRFPELDGMRGFLAFAVLIVHLESLPLLWMQFLMDCFFTISAFVITLSLLNSRAATSAELLRNFFIRRSARIFPLYYATIAAVALLLLALAVLPLPAGLHRYSLAELTPYLFYLQYTGEYGLHHDGAFVHEHLRFLNHTWSLAVEEQFYLGWGFVFVLARTTHTRGLIAIAFIALGLWARSVGQPAAELILYRIDAFGYGILLALLYNEAARRSDWCRLLSYRRICVPVFFVTLAIYLGVTDVPGDLWRWLSGLPAAPRWRWTPISALSAGCCAALVGALVFSGGSAVLAPLRTRPLQYLGSISYALYLIHYPVLDVLLHLNHPLLAYGPAVDGLLAVALVLGLSHFATGVFNRINEALVAGIGHSAAAALPPAASLPAASAASTAQSSAHVAAAPRSSP